MNQSVISIVFAWILVPLATLAEDQGGAVVVSRYKLAALTGLQHSAMSGYKSQLDPRGRQCVLLSLGHEFSGEFLFFAKRVGPDNLEIICFTPKFDGGKEWSGRFVKYEGEVKEQFEKIHKLLGALTSHPKEKKEDYRPVHGEAQVEIRVGEGDDITWAQPRAGFISKQPKLKEGLLQSISIAAAMAGMPLTKNLE